MLSSRMCLLAVCGLCLLPFSTFSQEPKTQEGDEGFVSLFNGTDLTGWKASEKGDWKVVDGAIVTPPQRSHLFTEKEFKNFIFRAEVMTDPGSNSGIYFHTEYEETFPTHGYECQVNTTHTDPVRNGSIYYAVKNYDPVVKDGEWYKYEIEVKGKNVRTRINGKVIVDYTEPDGVTQPRRFNKGSFAFQGHDPKSVVRYRNVRVKELP
jgi:hypothetical protein